MATKALPARNEVAENDTWDLACFFATDTQWESRYEKAEAAIAEYETLKGTLGKGNKELLTALKFDSDLSRQLENIYVYAHLKNDEDKTNPAYDAMMQRAISLHTRQSEAASFLMPEIQSLPEERITAALADDAFSDFRFSLENIMRNKPHTLTPEVETVLAATGEMAQAPRTIFSQLNDADLTFGTITNGKGETLPLTHGNYISLMQDPVRDVRKTAFHQYYGAFEAHEHTLAAALSASIQKDWFYARTRKFSSCREASLFRSNIPTPVYDRLIDAVRSNISCMKDYLSIRKSVLGIQDVHMYDTYVPMVKEIDFRMDFDEAVATCLAALEPLGEKYVTTLKKGFESRWVDRYENKGKRSGAYSSGAYDSPPYMLMNYNETSINSLFTLVHEAGHSMHTHYATTHQPYPSYGYSIFVAEVASTFNEVLLARHLLEKYSGNPQMTAYIINREIDDIRGTLIRQTMFAEFEKITHARAEARESLTLKDFREIYKDLLSTYFAGELTLDDHLVLECFRIPHFYSAFYVYQYATGISAALALATRVLEGNGEETEKYLNFLKCGGSVFPLEALRVAGVDMETPEPVDMALDHFRKLIAGLETALHA